MLEELGGSIIALKEGSQKIMVHSLDIFGHKILGAVNSEFEFDQKTGILIRRVAPKDFLRVTSALALKVSYFDVSLIFRIMIVWFSTQM